MRYDDYVIHMTELIHIPAFYVDNLSQMCSIFIQN